MFSQSLLKNLLDDLPQDLLKGVLKWLFKDLFEDVFEDWPDELLKREHKSLFYDLLTCILKGVLGDCVIRSQLVSRSAQRSA